MESSGDVFLKSLGYNNQISAVKTARNTTADQSSKAILKYGEFDLDK
jgi:hypothetical protein